MVFDVFKSSFELECCELLKLVQLFYFVCFDVDLVKILEISEHFHPISYDS